MDIGSVILHRFDVAFLKCAGCPVPFDNEPAAVELRIRRERNPVVVFHEYLAADRLVAGPGAVDIRGVGRRRKRYGRQKCWQRQRKAVRGRHRDPPVRSEPLHVLYVTTPQSECCRQGWRRAIVLRCKFRPWAPVRRDTASIVNKYPSAGSPT